MLKMGNVSATPFEVVAMKSSNFLSAAAKFVFVLVCAGSLHAAERQVNLVQKSGPVIECSPFCDDVVGRIRAKAA